MPFARALENVEAPHVLLACGASFVVGPVFARDFA